MQSSSPETIVREAISQISGRTFMFLGAGATRSDRLPNTLQLPLGSELMDHLLMKAYPYESTLTDRIDRFSSKYECPATPDLVWHHLISTQGQLQHYYDELLQLFSPFKPVPPAYYMLARWFFTFPQGSVGGVGTTNFDEKFDSAFHTVAKSYNKRYGVDYMIPRSRLDFDKLGEISLPYETLVQKVHGTISSPWSIVAGPAGVDLQMVESNTLYFPPYTALAKAMSVCPTWVFVGYSFGDDDLIESIVPMMRETPRRILLVDPAGSSVLQKKAAKTQSQVHPVRCSSEIFFRTLLSSHPDKNNKLFIQLNVREKDLLQNGPRFLPGCVGRAIPGDYETLAFHDVVHPPFTFSDAVREAIGRVLDTGEMQRLRSIRQLSFVHLLAQTAQHDRFSHVLGVAHLADRFFTLLRNDQLIHRPNFVDAVERQANWENLHRSFCIACLIHDVGHGPLGHTIDYLRARLKDQGSHEQDSVDFVNQGFRGASFADFDKAFRKVGQVPDEVCAILSNKHPLSACLNNTALDLDRLDFLLRDAIMTGKTNGVSPEGKRLKKIVDETIASLDNILASIALDITSKNGERYPIAFDLSIKPLVKELAWLYKYMYQEVYYCWENASAQAMIAKALEEVVYSHRFMLSDVLRLTDFELFTALEEFENPMVNEIAWLVKYRRYLDYGIEMRFTGAKLDESELQEELGLKGMTFDVLATIRNPKPFIATFVWKDGLPNMQDIVLQTEELEATEGVIYVFRWPDVEGENSPSWEHRRNSLVKKLHAFIEKPRYLNGSEIKSKMTGWRTRHESAMQTTVPD